MSGPMARLFHEARLADDAYPWSHDHTLISQPSWQTGLRCGTHSLQPSVVVRCFLYI